MVVAGLTDAEKLMEKLKIFQPALSGWLGFKRLKLRRYDSHGLNFTEFEQLFVTGNIILNSFSAVERITISSLSLFIFVSLMFSTEWNLGS